MDDHPEQPITRFLQQNITDKQVNLLIIIHIGAGYQVSVSDGRITTSTSPIAILILIPCRC